MNKQSLSLGKIFGIPLSIDYSWFLIFALITWTLATGYFPSEFHNWPSAQYWIVGGVTAVLFFLSVLLHELGHSLMAVFFKIPVRSITLYIFGGASEIGKEPPNPLTDFWITIVGPLINLAIWGILSLATPLAAGIDPLLAVVKYLAYINLLLGLFNLIPGYPLDGGGVLMSIIWGVTHKRHWGVMAAATVGSVIAYVLIFFGILQAFGGNLFNGIWIAFIGWFILNASGNEARRERIKTELSGHTVAEAMNRAYVTIQHDTSLQELADEHILGSNRRSLVVEQQGMVAGLITVHKLQNVPKEAWPTTPVSRVMIPLDQIKQITPNTEIWEAIEAMDSNGFNQLPVIVGREIQGILSREDVISYLRKLSTAET